MSHNNNIRETIKGEKKWGKKSHTNLENTECQTCAIAARLIDGGNKTAEWAPEPGSAAKKAYGIPVCTYGV